MPKEHVVVLKKRHPMLEHTGGPEIEKECASCGQPWPCEVVLLKAEIKSLQQRLAEYAPATCEHGYPLTVRCARCGDV